jgi:hypothetical protein
MAKKFIVNLDKEEKAELIALTQKGRRNLSFTTRLSIAVG